MSALMTMTEWVLTMAVLVIPILLVHYLWFEVDIHSAAVGVFAGMIANGFERGWKRGRSKRGT